MPGIYGIIGDLPKEEYPASLKKMAQSFLMEPFYQSGNYVAEKEAIGWISHQGTLFDGLPIINKTKDVQLFITGEIYEDRYAVDFLKSKGYRLNGDRAQYLVHLYEELGDKFFERLNGLFSGLLIDQRVNRSFLFNDRYGMSRIFYLKKDGRVYFSSEAKAILSVVPESREFDPCGVTELMTCGCTLDEQSIFKNIRILPNGSVAEFNKGVLRGISTYFDQTDWEQQPESNENAFIEDISNKLKDIIHRYMLPDEPIGMSLTGGLDSRMLLSAMDLAPGQLPCYTFGSIYRDSLDVKISRRVASLCGQAHDTIPLSEKFLDNVIEYLEKSIYISDGYIGLSGAAELYVNANARKIAPIRLTGNWGSELLRGIRAYGFGIPKGDLLVQNLRDCVEETKDKFQKLARMNSTSFVAFHQAPNQSYGRHAIERSQLTTRSPFLDNEIVKLIYQGNKRISGTRISSAIVSTLSPNLLSIPTDRGHLSNDVSVLRYFRRMYYEVLFKAEYYINTGTPNWMVRINKVVQLHLLEKILLGRHKFFHLRDCLNTRISKNIDAFLQSADKTEIFNYIDRDASRRVIEEHFSSKKNYSNQIDMILMLIITCYSLLKQKS